MLPKGQEAVYVLHNINEKNKWYIYMSRWFNFCCTGLTFGERLTIDDAMTEDETTQTGARAGSSHAVNEPESSSKRFRRR
jgi:hypothetical protein